MAWYTNTTAGLLQRNGGGRGVSCEIITLEYFHTRKKRKVEPKGLPSYLTL